MERERIPEKKRPDQESRAEARDLSGEAECRVETNWGEAGPGKATAKREPKRRAEDCGNGKAKIKTGDRDGGAQTAGGRPRARMEPMRPGAHHNLGANTRVAKAPAK